MSGHTLTSCCRVPHFGELCPCCNQPCEPVHRPEPLDEEFSFTESTPVRYDYPEVQMPVYAPRFTPNTDEEFDFYRDNGWDEDWHSNEQI